MNKLVTHRVPCAAGTFTVRPGQGMAFTINNGNTCTYGFFNNEAVDFLDQLLRYDHQERLTAREAQSHAYFGSS